MFLQPIKVIRSILNAKNTELLKTLRFSTLGKGICIHPYWSGRQFRNFGFNGSSTLIGAQLPAEYNMKEFRLLR